MKLIYILLFIVTCMSCKKENSFSYNIHTGALEWQDVTILPQTSIDKKLFNLSPNLIDHSLTIGLSTIIKKDTVLTLPLAIGEQIYLPIGGGKLFSTKDTLWISHLADEEYSAITNLSMPFIAIGKEDKAIVYILENPTRTSVCFSGDNLLKVSLKSEFIEIDSLKKNNIRVYITENNTLAVSTVYKNYITTKNKVKTLVDQTKNNPNISKLFGAPHFYLWDKSNKAITIINDMYDNGIKKAWIGFETWEENIQSRKLVELINSKGYLVAPYDDYHCIHEPGDETWSTATFQDPTLFKNASIMKKDGTYLAAFLNVGHFLNPIYSMDEVKYRTNNILSSKLPFNSWFIDCDATGEVHDDYSKMHISTKQQNLDARLNRMNYIKDSLNMVIGSENGNDFSCSTIAFAHGLDIPVFTWMDWDMNKNTESPYFVGSYYNPIKGEVASRFSKQVPLKDKFYNLFYNPIYSIPLYKLVYNDVIVSANHWEWPSLKVPATINERMLYEVSYNSAPLYHISVEQWKKHKKEIVDHVRVWSKLHEKLIKLPMSNFQYLTQDKKVQYIKYGTKIKIITNYSKETFKYQNHEIPAISLLVIDDINSFTYTPNNLVN